jgi:hypothetical protein
MRNWQAWKSPRRIALVASFVVGAVVLSTAYRKEWVAFLVGSEVVQVGQGETSYFLQKCRYVSLRGRVFEQSHGEESLWRLGRFPCARYVLRSHSWFF